MGRITYKFTIPDYQEYEHEELNKAFSDVADRILFEFELAKTEGLVGTTKKLTSLFIKLNFILQAIEYQCPGILDEVSQDHKLRNLLSNFNIETNGED